MPGGFRDQRQRFCRNDLEGVETEQEAQSTDPFADELFPATGGGVIVPPTSGGKKPSNARVVKWLERTRDKAEAAVRIVFDNTLGGLFDEMEDEIH